LLPKTLIKVVLQTVEVNTKEEEEEGRLPFDCSSSSSSR
jgi:hypothetical protein